MDGRLLARIAAIIFVSIAITAMVIGMIRKEEPMPASSAPSLQPPADPLREGQRRCQQMGEAAARDAGCLAVWAESRDRFLGRSPSTPAEGR